jgi:hypothetical protein
MAGSALITTFNLVALLSFLALLVPPLITVIISARLGDTGKISFLSWFGTAVLSCIVYYLLLILSSGVSPLLGATWVSLQLLYGFIGATLYVVIGAIVNAFFYGCFSFLFGKSGL